MMTSNEKDRNMKINVYTRALDCDYDLPTIFTGASISSKVGSLRSISPDLRISSLISSKETTSPVSPGFIPVTGIT